MNTNTSAENDNNSINRYKIQNELRRRKNIRQRLYEKETCSKMFTIVTKFVDNYTKSKITGNNDQDDFQECLINGKENFNLVITSLESILRLMRRKRKNNWKAYNARYLNQNQNQNQIVQKQDPNQQIFDEVFNSILTQSTGPSTSTKINRTRETNQFCTDDIRQTNNGGFGQIKTIQPNGGDQATATTEEFAISSLCSSPSTFCNANNGFVDDDFFNCF